MTQRTRTYVLVALVVLSSTALPLAAAQTSTGPLVSQTTTDLTTEWFGLTTSVDDRVIQYEAGGQLRPSWVVGFEAGTAQSVRDWANSSDSRRIVTLDNSSQTATVVAPVGDMGLTLVDQFLGGSLSDRSYVTSLEANFEIGVDPVELQPQSEAFDAPSGVFQGAFDQTGVAYTDAPRGTPADVRSALGFDNTSVSGEGITVGVIDSSLNTCNGCLLGNGTRGSAIRVDAAKNFVDANRPTGLDAVSGSNTHGTWVTSAIAANTTDPAFDGAAPDANITYAKALADDGSGETADISAAIRWQESQGADILSLSLGSPVYSQEIADALRDYLDGSGTLALVASGNSRQSYRYVSSPADVPDAGVLTIGATTAERPGNASSAYFSQVGPNVHERDGSPEAADGQEIDLAAPGMNTTVKIATETGTLQKSTKSGTSMATPWSSGVAAATLAANPSLENETGGLRTRLLDAARPIPSAGVTEAGHGMPAVDLAIDGEQPATEQADARTTAAQARDTANRAYAGQTQGFISNGIRSLQNVGSGLLETASSALPV